MSERRQLPPLKALHPSSYLIPGKLEKMKQLSTEAIRQSLALGQKDCLKTRPDGTILDGHHRIHILRERGWMSTSFRVK